MAKEKYITLRYYSHQDNRLNSDFIKIGNTYLRVEKISALGPINTNYSENRSYEEDGKAFTLVCDGVGYKVVVASDKVEKVYGKITDMIFRIPETKEKQYI